MPQKKHSLITHEMADADYIWKIHFWRATNTFRTDIYSNCERRQKMIQTRIYIGLRNFHTTKVTVIFVSESLRRQWISYQNILFGNLPRLLLIITWFNYILIKTPTENIAKQNCINKMCWLDTFIFRNKASHMYGMIERF